MDYGNREGGGAKAEPSKRRDLIGSLETRRRSDAEAEPMRGRTEQ